MTEENNVATTVDEETVVAVAKTKKAGTRKKAVKDESIEKVKVPVDLLKEEKTPDTTQSEPIAAVDTDVATLAKQVNVADLAQLLRPQIMDDVRAEIAAGTERLVAIIEAQNQRTAELIEELRQSKRAGIWTKLLKR